MREYRIKQTVDSKGCNIYTIQCKRLGVWWDVTHNELGLWLLDWMFGCSEYFFTLEKAKEFINRKIHKTEVIYHYPPFEEHNN